jgi:hypothetical protein
MAGAALVAALLLGTAPLALANLPGSTFEGNDGNLVVDTPGNTDWANAPNRVVGLDLPSGPTDNSFGQGTKEDSPNVTVVTGSIPPNKNDLTRFYIGSEFTGGNNFLYLAWERAVNIGSANLDLEINQNATAGFTGSTTGPVTLNRTAGDLLVTYDFSGSGTPTLGLLKWVTSGPTSQCFSSNTLPCWGNRVDLTGLNEAEGAVNTGTVTDPVPPGAPRTLTAGLFGEAAINLSAAGVFPPGTCKVFGSTFLKSRSSSSFGAEVKDFIAPQPLNISNCGTLVIKKVTDPSPDPTNTSFSFTVNGPSSQPSGTTLPKTFTLTNGQTNSTTVFAGTTYSAAETVPANWQLTSVSCDNGSGTLSGSTISNITVPADATVTCTFNDKLNLGAIKITKTSSKAAATPLAGATFSITGPSNSTQTTGSGGTVCVDHLPFGSYMVQETAAPTGYVIDDPTAHTVVVNANSTCGDGHEATFSATDTPLTDVQVKATSEATGGTQSTITCSPQIGNSPQGPSGSVTVTANGLKPGTYACTIVVDP